jgi:hypothetical protein
MTTKIRNVIPARYLATDETGTDVWVTNINACTEQELLSEGFDTFDMKEDPSDEGFWINQMINISKESELLTEVVQFALKYQREDPRLTPAMAMKFAINEWLK